MISQKCQYALRAIFELARHYGGGPVKIADIAQAQAIPQKFLEAILGQLKQGGFVQSIRGVEGGYLLLKEPAQLSVGEVLQFVQGPIGPVGCVVGDGQTDCPLTGRCVFLPMWERVRKAVSDIYYNTTFQDLLDQDMAMEEDYVPCYQI